ncbi:MAG TPA: hypothetical protein VGV61_17810 [Thermoanaerobaculia bacterium]|jgi:hypothetical protein|nr:hypothetical protein [Thermoanaerobaculia bacterium]
MTQRLVLAVLAGLALLTAAPAVAATNLNSSRSNIYRLTYPTELIAADQVKALLADLDKLGATPEAKLKQWLPANFKRFGVDPAKVKKVVILPPDATRKEIAILLLTDPADEAAAVAVTVKSSKSNSSD